MAQKLLIVESPSKAKTINKYLGKDFVVLASHGHVRDLVPKEGAVEVNNDFKMHYELVQKNKKHVDAILNEFKNSEALYLATDPDREGEAISWHIKEIVKSKRALKNKPIYRIVFNEITKSAITEALHKARDISDNLVNAQQARRALDYLVGFNLSPLLWKKIRRGLSAGRVQSPALRMIVERELEIEKFQSQEYWTIFGQLQKDGNNFNAKLTYFASDKVEQFYITNSDRASEITSAIKKDLVSSNNTVTVKDITKKQRKRNPAPPFITSTLQQEAARKLGFTTQRTMRIAQQLYEGIDIGKEGAQGLITYMRTDSVHLSNDAIEEIRNLIAQKYGKDKCPKAPRHFKNKSKNAQEAHEAIRPTLSKREPDKIKGFLSDEQFKLYNLIWKRTVASQMQEAILDTVAIDFTTAKLPAIFRVNGSTIKEPGFMAVYLESKDDVRANDNDDNEKLLPEFTIGEKVNVADILEEQHFTEPPPRYSEASLIKALVEHDIGRPSTYASIISTLQNREYVILETKRFRPTDVGKIVNKFLTEYFTNYVDYEFTAHLEDELDAVSRGEVAWIPVLENFWQPFHNLVNDVDKTVQRKDVTQEKLDEQCPKCNGSLSLRLGKRGRFVGCDNYPECDYTRGTEGESDTPDPIIEDRVCPKCSSSLVIKHGPYGKFIGCSSYPKCKFIEPLEKPRDTEVECPKCHKGNILERKSKKGKIFFSCATYPKCDFALWNEPIKEPCPKCNFPILTIKTTKKFGKEKICSQKTCDFKESID